MKQNQSKVEDTLSENRQSKVEEDFANFFNETRMDALEKMEKSYLFKKQIEIDIYCPRLLCLIFEVCLAITNKLFACALLVSVVVECVDFVVVYGDKCITRISSRYRDVHYEKFFSTVIAILTSY